MKNDKNFDIKSFNTNKKLESIEKINLANSNWWQPKIEKQQLKNLMKRSDTKAWIHTILYFFALFFSEITCTPPISLKLFLNFPAPLPPA